MKRIGGWVLAGIGVMLAGVAVDMAWAQGGPRPAPAPMIGEPGVVAPVPGDNRKLLVIRRMTKLNKAKQPTPQYNTSASRSSTVRAREWALFEVTFDTVPEWMDEIVVTYYLMADRRATDVRKGKEYTFYQTTVRYADVARGEHMVCAVLPPAALLRNGDQFIGLAVEISSADGKLLDVRNEMSGSWTQADWWKKPEITESKNVVKREGLVDRSKTPFGLINIDDYEVVK